MPFFAFVLIFLNISAYSVRCLLWPFSTITRDLVNRARVGDNILHFSVLVVALATFVARCWVMSVMLLLMVSMSSISCSVSNHRFLNSNFSYLILCGIYLGGLLLFILFLFTSIFNLILLIVIMWSLPMLT